jgi:hypothetical protein
LKESAGSIFKAEEQTKQEVRTLRAAIAACFMLV